MVNVLVHIQVDLAAVLNPGNELSIDRLDHFSQDGFYMVNKLSAGSPPISSGPV